MLKIVLAFKLSDVVFIMLINVKMPAIWHLRPGQIVKLTSVEYKTSFITPGPDNQQEELDSQN